MKAKPQQGNGALKIEQGIPMPGANQTPLSQALRVMEVGDSFLVSKRPIGNQLAMFKPKRFATRAVEGGYRVWRTE